MKSKTKLKLKNISKTATKTKKLVKTKITLLSVPYVMSRLLFKAVLCAMILF